MGSHQSFIKLFEPGRIGGMEIRNRIVMPAMVTCLCTEDGRVTLQTRDYYKARAKGGAGLIIVESSCVDLQQGRHSHRPLAVDHDQFIPGLKKLSSGIQKYGAKAAIQLSHSGGSIKHTPGVRPVGPSAIAGPGGKAQKELSQKEIEHIAGMFAAAAKRVRAAGFNGIEIHAAHTYLIAQFLSPFWNKRNDRYGGNLENRSRFLLEILKGIRAVVGESYPLWCRINGEEQGRENGTTIEEAKELSWILEHAGVDAINVSASRAGFTSSHPNFFASGYIAHLANGVKSIIGVPVMAAGRIGPTLGEELLKKGKADFIVMGRAFRADAELPNKLAAGRIEDIRPCLACNACIEKYRSGGQRLCAVNAAIGREREYKISKVELSKRVLIVGGGPAGMETARIAAMRGHEVTLCEKGGRLGGKLLPAAVPPCKSEIEAFRRFLIGQIKTTGVKIKLNTQVDVDLIRILKPDVIIVATGTIPIIPNILGVERKNVFTADQFLSDEVQVGGRVIVLGGGVVGCEVAEVLAEAGKRVTIVEILAALAHDMTVRQGRQNLLDILSANQIAVRLETKSEQISDEGMVVVDKSGKRQTIEADTVIIACGYLPNDKILKGLNAYVEKVFSVGDCSRPRTILEAIHDGADVARKI